MNIGTKKAEGNEPRTVDALTSTTTSYQGRLEQWVLDFVHSPHA